VRSTSTVILLFSFMRFFVVCAAAVTVDHRPEEQLVSVSANGEVRASPAGKGAGSFDLCGLVSSEADRCGLDCDAFQDKYCADWESIVDAGNVISEADNICCSSMPLPCRFKWGFWNKKYCSRHKNCIRPGCGQEGWYAEQYNATAAAVDSPECLFSSAEKKCGKGDAADLKLERPRRLKRVVASMQTAARNAFQALQHRAAMEEGSVEVSKAKLEDALQQRAGGKPWDDDDDDDDGDDDYDWHDSSLDHKR